MSNAQMNGERAPQGQQDGSPRPQTQQQGQTRQPAETDRPQMGSPSGLTDWASI